MSQTLDTRYLRNKDIIDQSQLQSVTVIGCGGIGSAIVQSLAIMGFNEIILYDNDTVEPHNLSTGFFKESSLNMRKNVVAKKSIQSYKKNTRVITYDTYDGQSLSGHTIICVDSMEPRLMAFESFKHDAQDNSVFVDARMDALAYEVITVKPNDFKVYLSKWQPSTNIPDAPCTMKHTIFTAQIVSGMAVNQLFCAISNRGYHKYIWHSLGNHKMKKEHFSL